MDLRPLEDLYLMRRRTRSLLVVLTAVGVVAASLLGSGAAAAQASATQYGMVTFVDDGDTVDVDIEGDGTDQPVRVRITAIQATELHVYSSHLDRLVGECHGVDATKRMHALTFGQRVRLTALSLSATSNARLRRSVAILQGDAWRDVGEIMVDEGMAFVSYQKGEYSWNQRYRYLTQRAAALGRGIWNRDSCGVGPSAEDPLRVTVNWDADGDDQLNVNGEFVRITNGGPSAVPLGGWWVRDSALRRYTFPGWAQVLPGQTIYVHAGDGTASATQFYFGLPGPMFENVTEAPTYLGDGAYLFDPQGDFRAWQQYPCVYAC